MTAQDFTTTLLVDHSPQHVFDAVTNVRGWWSEEIGGSTDKPGAEFDYRYEDVHRCKIRIIEFVPNEKVVWLVLDNYFKFTQDKSEWINTKISFEISEQDDKTRLRVTHMGLVPEYECFEICNTAWTHYIQTSLRELITTGKGRPNAAGQPSTDTEAQLSKTSHLTTADFTQSITVNASAHEAFDAINRVTEWWTENLEGHSQQVNDEFTVRFGDVHVSTQKLVELIPGQKVVWLVTDSALNFIEDKQEWTGTEIRFEITQEAGKTQVRFTHMGLVPEIECFGACSNAWGQYIHSLADLINTGKGQPEPQAA